MQRRRPRAGPFRPRPLPPFPLKSHPQALLRRAAADRAREGLPPDSETAAEVAALVDTLERLGAVGPSGLVGGPEGRCLRAETEAWLKVEGGEEAEGKGQVASVES